MLNKTWKGFKPDSIRLRSTHLEWVLLFCVLLTATVWRFYQLDYRSLGYDEVEVIKAADAETLPEVVVAARNHMSAPPVDYLLRHFWQNVGGVGDRWVRAYGGIWGVAGVLLTYLVGRKLFGVQAGLLGGLFLAVSSFHVRYSAEVKFYALLVTGFLAVLYFWLNARTRKTLVAWFVFVVVCILAFYIHPYTVFAAAFCVISSFWQWLYGRALRIEILSKQSVFPETLLAVSIAVGLYLPWVLWDFIGQEPGWAPPEFSWKLWQEIFSNLIPGARPGMVITLIGIAAAVGLHWRNRRFETFPLWLTISIAPLFVYVLDWTGNYPLIDKQLIFIQPALFILATGGWIGLFRAAGKKSQILAPDQFTNVAVGLLACYLMLISFPQLAQEKDPANWQNNNWREVIRTILQTQEPVDKLLWATHDDISSTAIEWYLQQFQLREQAQVFFPWWESRVLSLKDIQQLNQGIHQGAWLFGPEIDELFESAGLTEAVTYTNYGNVRIYRINNLASWTDTLISSKKGLILDVHPYSNSIFLSNQYIYELTIETVEPLSAGSIRVQLNGHEPEFIAGSNEDQAQRFILRTTETGEHTVQISNGNTLKPVAIESAHLLPMRRIGPVEGTYRAETWEMQLSGEAQGITDDQLRTAVWEYISGDAATIPIWAEVPGTYQINVAGKAWGPPPALIQVLVDGNPAATLEYQADDWQTLSTAYRIEKAGAHRISLVFTNDSAGPDGDRNAIIDWMELAFKGAVSFQPDTH